MVKELDYVFTKSTCNSLASANFSFNLSNSGEPSSKGLGVKLIPVLCKGATSGHTIYITITIITRFF